MLVGSLFVNIKCIDNFSEAIYEQMRIMFWLFLDKEIRNSVLEAFEE